MCAAFPHLYRGEWIRRLLSLDARKIDPRPRFFLRTTDAWLSQAPPLILAVPRRPRLIPQARLTGDTGGPVLIKSE
jgi:hypothetical protein